MSVLFSKHQEERVSVSKTKNTITEIQVADTGGGDTHDEGEDGLEYFWE